MMDKTSLGTLERVGFKNSKYRLPEVGTKLPASQKQIRWNPPFPLTNKM